MTGEPSMSEMPSASTAHIDHTVGPPSMVTACAVGTAEEGVRGPDPSLLVEADHVVVV